MKWLRGKSRSGSDAGRRPRGGWLGGLFGARKIENLIDEDFPSWEDYSAQKAREVEEAKQAEKFELPPYKVNVSSPLQRNFLYALIIGGALGLGYAVPGWAPVLIYGAIGVAFAIALFTIIRDGIFLHIEGQRLQVDGTWINDHTHGPGKDSEAPDDGGFLKSFTRKKKTIFRSRLLQIHYQNVLRAFEQGARRAWVYQDASIGEIQTLLSQGGMKLAWTVIEVLPQLGLLGTLIGLMSMFFAFRASELAPELTLISGFGTALGTTILANLFVLILRPLYMQNERTMNEILSTLQTLMAIFILPTQQYAMERSAGRALAQLSNPTPAISPPALTHQGEQRIQRSLEQLAGTMREFVNFQEKVDSGSVARETAQVALEVQSALRSFQESVNPDQLAMQQRALGQLTESVKVLSENLGTFKKTSVQPEPHNERIEHDLSQLRVLTKDTLVLLEQIANRLATTETRETSRNMLSLKFGVHAQMVPEEEESHEIKTVRPEDTQVAERGGKRAAKAKPVQAAPAQAEPVPAADLEPVDVDARPVEPVAARAQPRERPADRIERERAEQHEYRIEKPGRAEVSSPKIRLARDRS
jgi:hypothetical protein